MRLFSVYDKVAAAFLPMFPARNRGEAIRMCQDAAKNPQGQFVNHLPDYELFDIGEFDESSGILSGTSPNRVISFMEFQGD